MARITLYIREADQDVWLKAKALAGSNDSLSGVVVEALRDYVEREERRRNAKHERDAEMKPVELLVNVRHQHTGKFTATKHKVRFIGALLYSLGPRRVYLTRGGKLVSYCEDSSGVSWYDEYETIDDLAEAEREFLGDDALAEIAESMGEEYITEID